MIDMIPHSLSTSDLMLVDGFPEAVTLNNREAIRKILYTNGMDIGNKIEISKVEHVNLRGDRVNCFRYSGYERCDTNWLTKGAPSSEMKVFTSGMKDMGAELGRMSKIGASGEANYDSANYGEKV